jgi:hypothetical protein
VSRASHSLEVTKREVTTMGMIPMNRSANCALGRAISKIRTVVFAF